MSGLLLHLHSNFRKCSKRTVCLFNCFTFLDKSDERKKPLSVVVRGKGVGPNLYFFTATLFYSKDICRVRLGWGTATFSSSNMSSLGKTCVRLGVTFVPGLWPPLRIIDTINLTDLTLELLGKSTPSWAHAV